MEKTNFELYDEFPKDFWFIRSRQNLLRNVFKKIGKKKKLKVLDLGCGTGFNYPALKDLGEVHSADISKRALESCKKKGIPNLHVADAQKLSNFKDESFDVVCAIEIIEHLPDDRACIKEVHRILKKGGIFVFTCPAHQFLWSSDDVLAHHERRYSKKELQAKIKKHFSIRFLSYRYFFLFFPALVVFLLQKIVKRSTKKYKNSLTFTPSLLNGFILSLMKLENFFLGNRIYLPLGISFVGIAKKK